MTVTRAALIDASKNAQFFLQCVSKCKLEDTDKMADATTALGDYFATTDLRVKEVVVVMHMLTTIIRERNK